MIFQMHKSGLFLAILIFLGACVSTFGGKGLEISLQPDPEKVFQGKPMNLFVDVMNNDVKAYRNIDIEVFETGILDKKEECKMQLTEMKPGELKSMICELVAPQKIEQNSITSEIQTKASFDATLSAIQTVEIISENEYNRRIGKIQTKPKSYSYSDSNIALDVEFSDGLPLVVRNRETYIYLTIKNIGNGFVGPIKNTDLGIRDNSNIIECESFDELNAIEKKFSRITCKLNLDRASISAISPYVTYSVAIDLDYSYQVREKANVEIVR
ncbi:MAG: hypothetical protein V1802_02310 [Candidatus Aenigmatarchaeota archaeon]